MATGAFRCHAQEVSGASYELGSKMGAHEVAVRTWGN